METRLLQTIDQISKQHASLDHMHGSATAQLQCLEEELAQEVVEAPSLPELPAGPSMVRPALQLAAADPLERNFTVACGEFGVHQGQEQAVLTLHVAD